jgi:hypothetical protein
VVPKILSVSLAVAAHEGLVFGEPKTLPAGLAVAVLEETRSFLEVVLVCHVVGCIVPT